MIATAPKNLHLLRIHTSPAYQFSILQDVPPDDVGLGADDDGAPPPVLMEAPPLAVFANGILGALNELRHCAPLTLRTPLAKRLQVPLVG